MTRRIKLTVAYDGTDFRGWAAQSGHRTVQSTLTEAVRHVSGEDVEITGASRTDSGAHASGQVCHFDTTRPIEERKWVVALNRVLPPDVAVREARNAHPEFNSRFWAKDRTYVYRISTGSRDPLRTRYVHDGQEPLDVDAMVRAGARLVGRHDFRAFTEELAPHIDNTVRDLYAIEVRTFRDEVWIEIRGTAFLRGMMRRMSGALWEIGRGKRAEDDLQRLLSPDLRSGLHWPVVLPAKGLRLVRIRYGRHPRDARLRSQEEDE